MRTIGDGVSPTLEAAMGSHASNPILVKDDADGQDMDF